jgi:hypothetical protein
MNDTAFVIWYRHISDNVKYDPHDWCSSFSATMGQDYYSGIKGGVYYIVNNGGDYYFNFNQNQQISSAAVDYQISAGTDQSGYNQVYVLNIGDHNVFERHSTGWWSMIDCQGTAMEIADSVKNVLYVMEDPWGPGDEGAPYMHESDDQTLWEEVRGGNVWMWNGNGQYWSLATYAGLAASHISAGTDIWGNSTLDYITWNGYEYYATQYNAAYNTHQTLGYYVTDVCAGFGTDYYVGAASNAPIFQIDHWNGMTWQIGDDVRHDGYWY